ncbi:MAG: chemotaxis protein CheD [Lachnospiraceae bacterium]|nr:chemotaxis protein CheD [Lachnospiraceae bacterium]
MSEMIKVGMADLKLCISPNAITTLGLGSCVGIALRDPITKIGGLAHIMLPDSTKITNNQCIAKFADTGIAELVRIMVEAGASRNRLVAKIAGGAQMFALPGKSETIAVGARNAEAVVKILGEMKIPILARDTGDSYGRTVEFFPETGDFIIKAIGKEIKKI